ncbi:MAG: class I SAM-dependent RNA methyltransferase [Jatrophihabitantaceae bacterium]
MSESAMLVGTCIEVDVSAVAHGGFCVARYQGRVIFVRHALPGERVRAQITEDRGGSFARADAVQILRASPDRVVPPCEFAGPGRCGGCDWQHVSGPAQRVLKHAVVTEQFRRLAGLDVSSLLTEVEQLPNAAEESGLLGWRTRITYAVGSDGRTGLHQHRSHHIEPVDHCPLGVPGVGDSPVLAQQWPGLTGVEPVRDGAGTLAVLAHRPGPGRQARGRRPPDRIEVVDGPDHLQHELLGRPLQVAASGFWQVHPAALQSFAQVLLEFLLPRPGEHVLDLYAGAGPLTAVLADAVGTTGRVVGIESSAQAVADADANLADQPWAEARRDRVTSELLAALDIRPDLIVLDPPRAGAGRAVMNSLVDLMPRAIGYVACDPAALARDAAVVFERGWVLRRLRAIDAFPMTHHVECIALFEPAEPVTG